MPENAMTIDGSDWRARVAVFARRHWRAFLVAVASLALTAIYLFGNPHIFYHDSDPLTYFRKAWWILGRPGGIDVASRGPGYPIWLILTGVATLDRWWFLMASQFAMAAASPVLVYGMLAPVSRNAGLAAALLFAGFGIPYVQMNWVLTEQVFLFFELLALMLIARYLQRPPQTPPPTMLADGWPATMMCVRHWRAGPYPIVLVLAYDTMIRPTSGPLFWIFLAICLVFRMGPARRYVGPALLFVSLMLGWTAYVYHYGPDRFPTLGMPGTEAQRYFADAYYANPYAAVTPGAPAIRPDDGPASRRLYAAVEQQIEKARAGNAWNSTDAVTVNRLYRRFDSDAVLAREVFARTNPLYFTFVLQAAASAGGDRLLYQVAREHGTAGLPGLVRHLASRPTAALTGPPNPYLGYMMMQKYYLVQHYRKMGYSGLRDLISGPLPSLVRDENGPVSKLMTDSAGYFMRTFPQFVSLPKDIHNLDELKTRFVEPDYIAKSGNWLAGYLYTWLTMLYGETQTGRLMGKAAMEAIRNQPVSGFFLADFLTVAVYGEGSWGFFAPDYSKMAPYGEGVDGRFDMATLLARPAQEFERIKKVQEAILVRWVKDSATTQLPRGLARSLGGEVTRRSELARSVNGALLLQYSVFKWAKPILFGCVVVFALPLILAGIGARFVLFLTLAFFASAAALTLVQIAPISDSRHEQFFAFFPLLIGVLGIASIPRFLVMMRNADRSGDGKASSRTMV